MKYSTGDRVEAVPGFALAPRRGTIVEVSQSWNDVMVRWDDGREDHLWMGTVRPLPIVSALGDLVRD